MSESAHAKVQQQTPQVQLIHMAKAHWVSGIVYAAAQMNLADHLVAPMTAADLARLTKCDASSLYRIMRTLAGMGVFTEDSDHQFSLTPLGKALRTGTPDSVRSAVLFLAGDGDRQSLGQLHYSIQTGKTAFEKIFGMGLFEWFAEHPVDASMFSKTMTVLNRGKHEAVAEAYDFSQAGTVVDVGGANGSLLATVLTHYREPRGILFDLPHVVRDAPTLIKAHGLTDRIAIEYGSFLDRVPATSGAYMLSHIIHDWGEDQCLTILRNCRRAMKPNSRLLIIEMVLPTGNTPHPGKMLDIVMLAVAGGQERTEPEYRELLEKTGFQLTRVVPTESAVSIVEALPA